MEVFITAMCMWQGRVRLAVLLGQENLQMA